MYLKSINACCAKAFPTILSIHSETSEKQCLKRIPDLQPILRKENLFSLFMLFSPQTFPKWKWRKMLGNTAYSGLRTSKNAWRCNVKVVLTTGTYRR